MGRTRDDGLAPARDAAAAEQADGTPAAVLPPDRCRLCWPDRPVRRGGVWMLQHRGPFADCTHSCHDEEAFLPSTS